MSDSLSSRESGKADPIGRLALDPFCGEPPKELSLEQRFALHEFYHAVLAAGYKLYQVVPVRMASPIIREKFKMMIGG